MADDKKTKISQKVLNGIIEDKGGTEAQYKSLMSKIAWHESAHTMDPTIKQYGGGPGRGVYQFEGDGTGSNRIYTSAVRAKNYFEMKGWDTPEYISNIIDNGTGDASKLTRDQQDVLFLSDLRMKGGLDLSDYVTGKLTASDIWADHWWIGHGGDQERRQAAIDKFKKSISTLDEKYAYNSDNNFADVKKQTLNNTQERNNIQVDNTATQQPFQFESLKQPDLSQSDISYTQDQSNFYSPSSGIGVVDLPEGQPNGNQPQQADAPPQEEGYLDYIQNYVTQNKLAFGGDTNGQSIMGEFNKFNTGGSHEQNPNGGIPLGINNKGGMNTTEQNETTFDFKEGKYVFSDRFGIDTNMEKSSKDDTAFADGGFITGNCGGPGEPPCPDDKLTKDVNNTTGIDFNVDTANRLFETIPTDGSRTNPNPINFGKYKDVGYFKQGNTINGTNELIPTINNPHSMESMKQLLPYLHDMNPGMQIAYRHVPRGKRK